MAGRAGGPLLFHVVNMTLLVATIGSGMGSQLGAARLLMAWAATTPSRAASSAQSSPSTAFRATTCCSWARWRWPAHSRMTYELGAELLNFGAIIGFMGVNAAAFIHYYLRSDRKSLRRISAALAGLRVLPGDLDQPAQTRSDRRRHLADGRRDLRGHQDQRLPQGDRVLRSAAGVGQASRPVQTRHARPGMTQCGQARRPVLQSLEPALVHEIQPHQPVFLPQRHAPTTSG